MAVALKANQRKDHAKSTTRQIRENGQVPAVVYGKDKEVKSVAVDSIELIKTIREEGRNGIISLDIEQDKPVDVMLHDYQMDPLKDELIHADFYIVNMAEEMDVQVAVRAEGEAKGAKDGGILQQPLYELQVRAKPGNIPEEITVDVSQLEIGDTITVGDLPKVDTYTVTDEEDTTIVTVVPPDTMQDVEEAPEEGQEPELVENTKGDGEEEN
ncbi:50S ribosomal protein L25/general stress protein Ctc [Oceanobacillus halotolerans]|uniref:50S ribosomal protein L25/general stress protein Ctc n=1 Tax=Oceanobacillus halotolerans TaxID=2663380 RepID=UPI0013DB25F9|nr:50S ribosomal protein L25/general stress protein Ctc [Oceanobacillus halotolerans]